ncbi:MAG: glutamate racemase [Bacteroidales bacterium]|nr:glutamate racemase [Bacteroidales bacterium]MDD4670307.1 glutamate racemase [Bacteroidales bacterium]
MIGIFDSGVGGLSVWRELITLMPGEDYVYVSDSGNCPYGPKSADFIIERASAITEFLIKRGAEIIVVACNTATAGAIAYLRAHYSISFVGMEPALKPAALCSKSGVVGVLATKGTFKGKLYLDTLARFANEVQVISQVGEGLVESVEKGILEGLQVETLLHHCMDPMLEAGADHIVLGCTHYPFLMESMRKIAGDKVVLVNPAPAVARQAQKVLSQIRPINNNHIGNIEFYSTGDVKVLQLLARKINDSIPLSDFQNIII